MKRDYLLPTRFRLWGWVLLVPSLFLGVWVMGYIDSLDNWLANNVDSNLFVGFLSGYMDEVAVVGLTLALLFIGFARRRQEDECVAALRLRALTGAVWIEYGMLVAGTLLVYDWAYLDFVAYNMFMVLVTFVILFYGLLWLLRKGRINMLIGTWLFPMVYRRIGGWLAIPSAGVCLCVLCGHDFGQNWLDEAGIVGLAIALSLVSFSRERQEDEYITSLRMKALVWAVYVSYGILIVGTLTIYGDDYLYFFFCNMFTLPIVFILKFRWMMYQLNKEEQRHDQ